MRSRDYQFKIADEQGNWLGDLLWLYDSVTLVKWVKVLKKEFAKSVSKIRWSS